MREAHFYRQVGGALSEWLTAGDGSGGGVEVCVCVWGVGGGGIVQWWQQH